jgi:outer membrane biosynthesis protein TonB
MNIDSTLRKKANRSALLIACFLLVFIKGVAQSGDPNFPTPIHNSNVVGKIAARDLGDARLTHHYYAFKATPGDLLITVNSRNLNGDIDLFTAGTLRPLLKITLYAESAAPVTKGVYLRRSEDLILRIEARSPNDDEGNYQLIFGGSFQPIYGEDVAENPSPTPEISTTPTSGSKTRRVSSVGARIEEPTPPVVEVAKAAPTPEQATPEPTPVEAPSPVIIEKPAEEEAPKVSPPPTTRTRPTGRRTPRTAPKTTEETKSAEPDTPAATETETKTPARGTNKRSSTTARTAKPPAEPEAESGPRLIIETNDGTLINRSMSNVRRVTVENGQVVVVNKDGTINRILLANVLRMAIQP